MQRLVCGSASAPPGSSEKRRKLYITLAIWVSVLGNSCSTVTISCPAVSLKASTHWSAGCEPGHACAPLLLWNDVPDMAGENTAEVQRLQNVLKWDEQTHLNVLATLKEEARKHSWSWIAPLQNSSYCTMETAPRLSKQLASLNKRRHETLLMHTPV